MLSVNIPSIFDLISSTYAYLNTKIQRTVHVRTLECGVIHFKLFLFMSFMGNSLFQFDNVMMDKLIIQMRGQNLHLL